MEQIEIYTPPARATSNRNHNLEYSLMESDLELFSTFGKIHILLPPAALFLLRLDQIAKILIFHLIQLQQQLSFRIFYISIWKL